jgi:protein-L-isoaspartate(D-aspartate) O-methyltransferase
VRLRVFAGEAAAGDQAWQRVPRRDHIGQMRKDRLQNPVDVDALAAAIRGPRTEVWPRVTLPGDTSFERLLRWLAGQPVPYGRLFVDRARAAEQFAGVVAPFATVSPAFTTAGSLAYLVLRKLDDQMWEFGVHGFGPVAVAVAVAVATRMCDAIRAWGSVGAGSWSTEPRGRSA